MTVLPSNMVQEKRNLVPQDDDIFPTQQPTIAWLSNDFKEMIARVGQVELVTITLSQTCITIKNKCIQPYLLYAQ